MIRLFAALSIPQEIAAALAPRQKGILGARWRPAESLHLTLRFFGAVPETQADDVDSELSVIARAKFDLSLEGVGAFGEGPESVWAGVVPSEPLERLARRCERAARRAGLTPEKRAFRPHVTLAYLKNVSPDEVGAWIQHNNLLKTGVFCIDRFGLYSSWLGDEGSVYRLERAYPLA